MFHGVGEATGSGELASSGGLGAELVSGVCSGATDGSGVGVVAGSEEEDEEDGSFAPPPDAGEDGGGGSEVSISGGNTGAESGAGGAFVPGLGRGAACAFPFSGAGFFFLSASFASSADCNTLSPTFARSSSIRFLALSLSAEPGCCRITSL